MKHYFLPLFFLLCVFDFIQAQDYSMKYGKITNDELNMTVYPKDTTAAAVVLYEDAFVCYDYRPGSGFWLLTDYKKKIKILKQEGIDNATISIPFYYASNSNQEHIEGLEVTAYNLENGKQVKTKLDKKYLFEEEINKSYRRLKFSIPNVKVGTVIEYKYKKSINDSYYLPDWEIQGNLPVISSTFVIRIPEYFIYNVDVKGYEKIDMTEVQENQQLNLGTNSGGTQDLIGCSCRRLTFVGKDIPSLKGENFVWCINDFTAGVRFELSGTNFPYDFYRPFSRTWSDIEKTLTDKTEFVTNSKISNPYKDEIKTLIGNITDKKQKAELIYGFVKSHIRWNDTYSFYGSDPKDAAKKGTGNNAQINFILMSALSDAGIKSYPVLISRRNLGRLPLTYPSIDKLNTFILAAEISDSSVVYMDGSATNGGLNVLPSNLLVDRGYIFEANHADKWVDLTSITKNEQRSLMIAQLDNEGNLKGNISTTFTNQEAYDYKSSFVDAKDSTDYIDKLQNTAQLTVDSLCITGKNPMSNMVKSQLFFTKKIDNSGEYIYLNPMLFAHISKNYFTQTERKLPIEFEYPYVYTSISSLIIPENYEIVELPKSEKVALNDNNGSCLYQIGQSENQIQFKYRFEINKTIFSFTEYPFVRDFYGQVATKNAEMIVLKKKQS